MHEASDSSIDGIGKWCRIQQEYVVALESICISFYECVIVTYWVVIGVCEAQCEGQVYSYKVIECKSCRVAYKDYAYVLFGDWDIPPIRVSVFAL